MKSKTEKRQISVLLVENDQCALGVTKECLDLQGNLAIVTVKSSDEAFAKMEQEKFEPDVIVCSLSINNADCFEFLKILRHNGFTTPFIVFSLDVKNELIIRAFELGADGFIGKWGNPEVVYSDLKRCIESVARVS
jgi:DNA-binding NarL/FixJ family response regulator